MVWEYRLRTDDRSPGRAGFGMEGGKVSEVYTTDTMLDSAMTHALILDVLGQVSVGANQLRRDLPKCHPLYNWMFAQSCELQGIGIKDGDDNEAGPTNANTSIWACPPIMEEWQQYVRTQVSVQFAPRPYAMMPDDLLGEPEEVSYTNINGLAAQYIDSKEYLRFVDFEIDPQPSTASAQHGQLYYRTGSGAAPNIYTFSGFPWMMIPDGDFRVTWYQVPWSVAENPDHKMYTQVGLINQDTFFGFTPGLLLYLGPKFKRYQPPVPALQLVGETGLTIPSIDKLVDITFHFRFTTRASTDLPATGNANWIPYGWNSQPWWKTHKFHYVTSPDADVENQVPIYLSGPMKGLFEIL